MISISYFLCIVGQVHVGKCSSVSIVQIDTFLSRVNWVQNKKEPKDTIYHNEQEYEWKLWKFWKIYEL